MNGFFRKSVITVHLVGSFIFCIHLKFNAVKIFFCFYLFYFFKEKMSDTHAAVRFVNRHCVDKNNVPCHLCRRFNMPEDKF